MVVGTGTIGEPLINLFSIMRKEIGVDVIFFHKRSPLPEEVGKVRDLIVGAGAELVSDEDKVSQFRELGLFPSMTWNRALSVCDVVIDCTPAGNVNKEKYYALASQLDPKKGFLAQGSEEGFGLPYAWTINDTSLTGAEKFIQIVSCNTHNILCVLKSLCMEPYGLDLRFGNFTLIRRASDISEPKGILGVEAEKTSHSPYGSHQAYDAARVLKTLWPEKKDFPFFAQALKAPTQYMHTITFHLELRKGTDLCTAKKKLKDNPLVAFAKKKSTNQVFGRARDSSRTIMGRIFNQTVFFEPSLSVSPDGTRVSGTCFTPQDANALLSSVAATLWLLYPKSYLEKMTVFDKFLFDEI